MPVYSFVCPACGLRFEERLSFNDSDKHVTCPQGHGDARRVFSTPSVVFKGSGFYVTDHRKPASGSSSDR